MDFEKELKNWIFRKNIFEGPNFNSRKKKCLKIYLIMIIILFLHVENDHISSQNFSARLLGLLLQYPLIVLKIVKKWILTFGFHWIGQQLVNTGWPRKFHCWTARNPMIIFHILVTFIYPKGNQIRHHLKKKKIHVPY